MIILCSEYDLLFGIFNMEEEKQNLLQNRIREYEKNLNDDYLEFFF
jgi:hypothetical protein